MISKRRFSLPRLDITGMWVFSLGVWFHIVARLVYSKPWMAFFSGGVDCGHPCAVRRIPGAGCMDCPCQPGRA